MISKEQYRIDGHLPEKFATYTGKGRTEGVSGTAARDALKNNDLQAFKRIMPDGTDKLYNQMRDELLKVVKEHNETHSLSEYLKENLKRF
jgi:predicted nucleotidyltransferase